MLHGFVSGMLRLYGRDPGRIVGLVPKAWNLAYRDLCTPEVVASTPTGVVLAFNDVAPELKKYPNYFNSWNGVCQGILLIANIVGRVDFDVKKDFSSASATFTWG